MMVTITTCCQICKLPCIVCIHIFTRSSPADKPFEHKGTINVGEKLADGRQSATANIEDAENALFTIQTSLFYAKRKAAKLEENAKDSESEPKSTITPAQVSHSDPTTVALSPAADNFMQLIHFGDESVLALERIIKDQALLVQHDKFEHADLKRFLADLQIEFAKYETDLDIYAGNLTDANYDAEQRKYIIDNAALLMNRATRKFNVLDMIVNDDKWLAPEHSTNYKNAKAAFKGISKLLTPFSTLYKESPEVQKKVFKAAEKYFTTILTNLAKVTIIKSSK